MIIDNFFLKKLQKSKELFILFSISTRNPFLVCDKESFDDKILAFKDGESAKQAADTYRNDGYSISVIKIPSQRINKFLMSLYFLGVNSFVFNDEDELSIPLEQLVKKPDIEKLMNDKIPRINPKLQITALYFLQEARRKNEKTADEKKKLKSMEEELAVNLFESRFIIAFDITGTDNQITSADKIQKHKLVTLKTKDNEIFLPCFSDFNEFSKFSIANKKGKFNLISLPFDKLCGVFHDAKGIVINPTGFNLMLKKDAIERLRTMYASD